MGGLAARVVIFIVQNHCHVRRIRWQCGARARGLRSFSPGGQPGGGLKKADGIHGLRAFVYARALCSLGWHLPPTRRRPVGVLDGDGVAACGSSLSRPRFDLDKHTRGARVGTCVPAADRALQDTPTFANPFAYPGLPGVRTMKEPRARS